MFAVKMHWYMILGNASFERRVKTYIRIGKYLGLRVPKSIDENASIDLCKPIEYEYDSIKN